METNNSRVPFWLDVRKEYVKDNFVKMVEYLKWCQHNPNEIGDTDDLFTEYNRTREVLREIAYDIADSVDEHSIYDYEEKTWNDAREDVRMLVTYLLAAMIRGESDHRVIMCVARMMLQTSRNVTEDALCHLREMAISCMKREDVSYYGLSWEDVLQWDERSVDMLRINFGQTKFIRKSEGRYIYSGHGTLTVDGNEIVMKMMNGEKCFANERTVNVDMMKCGVKIEVEKKNASGKSDDFDEARELCSILMELQKNLKPLLKSGKKTYREGDALPVRVVFCNGSSIRAVSIDPRYEILEGNVFVPPYICGIKEQLITSAIEMGDLIMVNVSEDAGFVLGSAFVEFDEEYIKSVDKATIGVYMNEYAGGHRWLTVQGVIVNVMGKDMPAKVKTAVNEGKPVCIDIQYATEDKSGNTIINATYSDEEEEESDWSYEEVEENAMSELMSGFREWTKQRVPAEQATNNYEEIEWEGVQTLGVICHQWSRLCQDTTQKYMHLALAALMMGLRDESNDKTYVLDEMRFETQLVRFARGEVKGELRFEPDSRMANLRSMQWRRSIIDCLTDYKEGDETIRNRAIEQATADETLDMVKNLVNASNTLTGRISQAELDRIKKAITRHLGVEDEFVSRTCDMTYYGDESDKLEFKTSVVYPPEHGGLPNPGVQIWNILKTVCGMMNSLSGGEILIGVMDNGYSCGVKNDIDYLYDQKSITEPTMDKYRLYVKYWVDKCLKDEMDMVEGVSLTTGRIRYVIEHNDEGHDILRIQVMPFEYGIVVFKNDIVRPQQIAACYLRSSGATIQMNAEMRNQMRERKLHSSADEKTRKLVTLQKACKERKQVNLVGYSSKSGKRDRVVEPYMMIAEHDAYLCYDTTVDKNPLREFKISRMGDVEILQSSWKYTNRHRQLMVDLFGMLENVDKTPFEIVLKLKPMAYNLLKDECARAEQFLSANNDDDKNEYPYLLKTKICSVEGVGRFYIGLAAEIKIVEGEILKEYAKTYVEKCFF